MGFMVKRVKLIEPTRGFTSNRAYHGGREETGWGTLPRHFDLAEGEKFSRTLLS
jgi:hypothetical protein